MSLDTSKQKLRDDLAAALDAGANLAAYAESVARLGYGTKDAMRNLVQEFEARAETAKLAIRQIESDQ